MCTHYVTVLEVVLVTSQIVLVQSDDQESYDFFTSALDDSCELMIPFIKNQDLPQQVTFPQYQYYVCLQLH